MRHLKAIFISLLLCQSVVAAPVIITSFADIVEPLMPMVVNIYTVKYNKQSDVKTSSLPEIIPLERFNNFLEQYNVPFSFNELYASPDAMALGSGFIVDPAGYIITNDHVVTGSDEIYVKLYDGTELPARIVGTDPKTDIALLKIDVKQKLSAVQFASSGKTRVGDVVIAIGNPFGFGGTVTTGIISSKGRDLGENQDELVDDFIQTDAAINTGNSGGPLFNVDGKVIGINTSIPDVGDGTNIGIGFAIPSDTVQNIMKQLKSKGSISRGRLDIAIQDVTQELMEALSLENNYGVLVADVRVGGVGEKAGLQRGDLIVEFNEQKVLNSRKLHIFVADSQIGEKVKIVVIRSGQRVEVTAVIEELKQMTEENQINEETTLQKSGIVLANLSPFFLNKFSLSEQTKGVVVVKTAPKELGVDLRAGDLILAINQQPVNDLEKFDKMYEKVKSEQKNNVVLLVKRRDISMFVALPIK
jgi:serine protease Do